MQSKHQNGDVLRVIPVSNQSNSGPSFLQLPDAPKNALYYAVFLTRSLDNRVRDEILTENSQLLQEIQALGGKLYLTGGGVMNSELWKNHSNSEDLEQLKALKSKIDPNNIFLSCISA